MALRPDTALELFAGGAGLALALQRAVAGLRTVCYVEREAYAAALLVARMGEAALDPAPVWDDVSTFDGRPWRGRVDLIAGGFPCQDISNAGKRAGIAGARSGLWSEFARIIEEVQPRYVFIENVAALKARGLDRVLSDLARLGFDAEWCCVRASDAGAPHGRNRIFILAWRVADADGRVDPAGRGLQPAGADEAARGGEELADAAQLGEREPHDAPRTDARSGAGPSVAGLAGPALADADRERHGARRGCVPGGQPDAPGGGSSDVADADLDGLQGERRSARDDGDAPEGDHADGRGGAELEHTQSNGREPPCEWPPGPDDLDGWRTVLRDRPDLEPSVRRVADGLAHRAHGSRLQAHDHEGSVEEAGAAGLSHRDASSVRDVRRDGELGAAPRGSPESARSTDPLSALSREDGHRGRNARPRQGRDGDLSGLRGGLSADEDEAREAVRESGVPPRTGAEVGRGSLVCGCNRVDRLRVCGNGVVPAQAELAFRILWERAFGAPAVKQGQLDLWEAA